ncbi:MAG: DUF3261 domain-containing protein [Desulfatitalea sp.]|nr:DUF3261 domain-containing protein [Desulfatitalea sp.]
MIGCRLHLLLLLLAVPTVSCARLPRIQPLTDSVQRTVQSCVAIYPKGDWQLLHRIDAEPPAGGKQTLLGLSQISTRRRTIHCVMMTLEGLVVFEARDNGAITVRRSVPPFDRPGMAEGIMADMRLIFFPPEQPAKSSGISKSGSSICRYGLPDGSIQDIEAGRDTRWTIRKYARNGKVLRTVRPDSMQGCAENGMPQRIDLQAPGLAGYRLAITLLEAEPLPHPNP